MEKMNLTLKQRRFVRYYLETGNATEAAMKAYKCKDEASAATIGWENLRKLDILTLFVRLMDKEGITDHKLLRVLDEGLNAMKLHSANLILKKDPKTGKLIAQENPNDYVEIEDKLTRHKYLETALKLKKKLEEANINIDQSTHKHYTVAHQLHSLAQKGIENIKKRQLTQAEDLKVIE